MVQQGQSLQKRILTASKHLGKSEGNETLVKIIVNNNTCTGCETCVNTCPVGVYEMKDGKSVPVKVDDCLVCRSCEAQCPTGSIQVIE